MWRLDRLGRDLRHLIVLLEQLQPLGIAFVSRAQLAAENLFLRRQLALYLEPPTRM